MIGTEIDVRIALLTIPFCCVVAWSVASAQTKDALEIRLEVQAPPEIECLQRPGLLEAIDDAIAGAPSDAVRRGPRRANVSATRIETGTRVTIRSGNGIRVLESEGEPCPELGDATAFVLGLWATSGEISAATPKPERQKLPASVSNHRRFAVQLRGTRAWNASANDTRSLGMGLGFFWRPKPRLELGLVTGTQFETTNRQEEFTSNEISFNSRTFDVAALIGFAHTLERHRLRFWFRSGPQIQAIFLRINFDVFTPQTRKEANVVYGGVLEAGIGWRVIPSVALGVGGSFFVIANREVLVFDQLAPPRGPARVSEEVDLTVTFEWGS